jgi:DNA polymerase III epsilon subunit-like protein
MIFAVFDTETTGLPWHRDAELSTQPRIIEFGGLLTDGIEIIDTLEFICNPGIAIEAIITEITGLKNEDLQDKPPFSEFVPQVGAFFQRAQGVIAHNEAFDKAMLAYDLARIKMHLSDIFWPLVEVCTVEQTFHQYGQRMRLQDLYAIHCGEWVQKHRALDDVMKLHEVAQKLGVYDAFKENSFK